MMITRVYAKVNEKLNSPQAIMGFMLAVLMSGWAFWAWANNEFVPRNEINVQLQQSRDDISALTELVTIFVEDMQIVNSGQLVRDKELALQIALATNQPTNRIEQIKGEIQRAKKYKSCLIHKDPNCKHLKPPE